MSRRSHELALALATTLLVTLGYLAIIQNGVPRSSSLLGHGLGIAGFLMMLGAETLYSWRKLQRRAGWGRLNRWLQAHVYLGLVGPFLVLLHSAWRLNGLAGAAMLLTIVMVASGFVCSYIYAAIPHSVDGGEVALRDLETQITEMNAQVQSWTTGRPAALTALAHRLGALTGPEHGGVAVSVWERALLDWRYQRQLRGALRGLEAPDQAQVRELARLLGRRYRLDLQARTLASARTLLGQARTIHILLGVVLFALAFVHIGAALYYATFAR